MRKFLLLIGILAACSPLQALASPLTDQFTILFGNTCMLHFYSQDKLRQEMSTSATPELPAAKAAFFLNNGVGTAWSVSLAGGEYVVALRNDNFCAVYARKTDVQAAHAGFKALVAASPPPLVAAELDESLAGPNTQTLKSVAYSWSRPGDAVELVFILTTSSEVAPMVQAMASVALSKRPNNSFKGKPLRGSP